MKREHVVQLLAMDGRGRGRRAEDKRVVPREHREGRRDVAAERQVADLTTPTEAEAVRGLGARAEVPLETTPRRRPPARGPRYAERVSSPSSVISGFSARESICFRRVGGNRNTLAHRRSPREIQVEDMRTGSHRIAACRHQTELPLE